MNVLVIAPHMDDEVLGCGGTIARHVDAGDDVHVSVVCNRAYDQTYDTIAIDAEKRCADEARLVLGYQGLRFLDLPDEKLYAHLQEAIMAIEQAVADVQPEIVYTSFGGDLHQDHRTVAHAVSIVLRASAAPSVRRALAFEVPSGTDQALAGGGETFAPNVFVDIASQLDRKISGMQAYAREMRAFPHPRSLEMLTAKARSRGAQAGLAAAEAFVLLREIV
ncbi:MAG: PIG-L family deacetylase [Chloroflexi bacterium]|nr:PIG-L family deacetylase [Chloroflexota bacterium]